MLTSWVDPILNQNLGKEFYNPKYPSVNWQLRVYPNIWQLSSGDFSNTFLYYYKILAGIYVSLVQVGLKDSKPLKAQFNIYTDDGNKIFCCPYVVKYFNLKI